MAASSDRARVGPKSSRARSRRAHHFSRCSTRDGDLRADVVSRPLRTHGTARKPPAEPGRSLRRHDRAARSRARCDERVTSGSDASRSAGIHLRLAGSDHARPCRWRARTRSASPPKAPLTAKIKRPDTTTMITKTLLIALACLGFLILPESVIAQATDTAQLGTVVVSASKVPRPAASLSQAVTVLLGDDLRARGVARVSDALREVPGASIVQSGSFGALTSLFLRGGASRY